MQEVRVFGGNGKIWKNVESRGYLVKTLYTDVVFWLSPPSVNDHTPRFELQFTYLTQVVGTTDKWVSSVFGIDGIQVEAIPLEEIL